MSTEAKVRCPICNSGDIKAHCDSTTCGWTTCNNKTCDAVLDIAQGIGHAHPRAGARTGLKAVNRVRFINREGAWDVRD